MKIKSFKLWLNIFTFVALGALVYVSRHQIVDAFKQLSDLNYFWLLMIIPLQLGNFSSAGKFYQSYLRNLGEKVAFKPLFKIALEMNFVNHVFPSGGVSGFGYLSLRMKSEGVSASKAALTQVMRHTLTFLSFIIFLVVALLILSLFGNASRFMVLISSTIIFSILVLTGFVAYIISSAQRIKSLMAFIPRAINKVGHLLTGGRIPRININKIDTLFQQLHDDYKMVHNNWKGLLWPMIWTIIMNLTELLTICVVYFAFGHTVNFGALIIAYAVASMAGLIAVLPGGVGVYEGLMTLVLASAGIAKALALSTTVMYRILTMILFLPLGFVYYQQALRQGKTNESPESHE